MLAIENLYVSYGPIDAVKSSNIEVQRGKVVALIGPNGAGKSTLLRSISGLTSVKSGKITFEGKDITNLPVEKRVRYGISQVLEGRRVFRGLTIEENLRLAVRFRLKLDKKEEQKLISTTYQRFPLLMERKNQRAGTFSGGQLQLLIFAIASITNPKLMLLDEPSLGLAPLVVKEIYDVINELKSMGVTILLAEQMASLAFKVADYAYVFNRGSITNQGSVEQLMEYYDKEGLAAAYLGKKQ